MEKFLPLREWVGETREIKIHYFVIYEFFRSVFFIFFIFLAIFDLNNCFSVTGIFRICAKDGSLVVGKVILVVWFYNHRTIPSIQLRNEVIWNQHHSTLNLKKKISKRHHDSRHDCYFVSPILCWENFRA